jgi:hypothetical protein
MNLSECFYMKESFFFCFFVCCSEVVIHFIVCSSCFLFVLIFDRLMLMQFLI